MIAAPVEPGFAQSVRGVRALLDRIALLQAESNALRARIHDLEALADTDPLVNLANRRAFVRELDRMLAYARRHGGPVSVVYFDLNAFKPINDTYGHAAGDAALVLLSQLLRGSVRASDLIGRMGGDEFVLALPKADADNAYKKAEALLSDLADRPLLWDGDAIVLRASYGVAEAEDGDDAVSVIARADAAMLSAKRSDRAARRAEQV